MPVIDTQGISLHYELHGARGSSVVVLLSGLGGAGAAWGAHVERFARDHLVVLPDQRGTGKTTRTLEGHSIGQLAADMAALLEHLDVGPAHIVGTSAGGLIAQRMALDHAHTVQSLVLASSFARPDPWFRREFEIRRKLAAEGDPYSVATSHALFAFSPRYASENADRVRAWVERIAALPVDREVALARIDMLLAHDELHRLSSLRKPTLVLCGDHDVCTPPHLSEELARAISGAERIQLAGGHLIQDEDEHGFFDAVSRHVARHPVLSRAR